MAAGIFLWPLPYESSGPAPLWPLYAGGAYLTAVIGEVVFYYNILLLVGFMKAVDPEGTCGLTTFWLKDCCLPLEGW